MLTLEFVKVCYKMGTEIRNGVIRQNSSPGIERGTFLCTSHCEIDVSRTKYTVLWELTSEKRAPTLPIHQSSICASTASTLPNDKEADADNTDDDEAVEATVHSLPFKVLETCYSTSQQEAVKEAHLSET